MYYELFIIGNILLPFLSSSVPSTHFLIFIIVGDKVTYDKIIGQKKIKKFTENDNEQTGNSKEISRL